MFPRDMVFLRNMSVDTLHKGDTEDNNNNNNNNNNNSVEFNNYLITSRLNNTTAYRKAKQKILAQPKQYKHTESKHKTDKTKIWHDKKEYKQSTIRKTQYLE